MRLKSFWFHYNKPASRKAGKPKLTVHFNKTCYIVDSIAIKCPTESKIRESQPHVVIAGKCLDFKLINESNEIKAFIS